MYDFHKYHALGNDYIVIDPNISKIELTEENIKLICHRNFGVGSDGILYGPINKDGMMSLKIFNPDGSEAEKSGNGIRIFSKYIFETGYVKDKTFEILTKGGVVKVEVLDGNATMIKVSMGKVTFRSEQIPVLGESREVINEDLELENVTYKVSCLSIGNPHCVIPLEEISKEKALTIGPIVEHHSNFPNRTNVQLLKVIDKSNIQIEIWERGAGYTMASGSSSCAAASVAFRLGYTDNKVNVHMPGGTICIEIDKDYNILMTGSVSSVAKGLFSDEFRRLIIDSSL